MVFVPDIMWPRGDISRVATTADFPQIGLTCQGNAFVGTPFC